MLCYVRVCIYMYSMYVCCSVSQLEGGRGNEEKERQGRRDFAEPTLLTTDNNSVHNHKVG